MSDSSHCVFCLFRPRRSSRRTFSLTNFSMKLTPSSKSRFWACARSDLASLYFPASAVQCHELGRLCPSQDLNPKLQSSPRGLRLERRVWHVFGLNCSSSVTCWFCGLLCVSLCSFTRVHHFAAVASSYLFAIFTDSLTH